MKKIILLISWVLVLAIPIVAAKEDVSMTLSINGRGTQNTTVKRTPIHLPVEVVYDSETNTVEVIGDDEFEARVSLTDESGNTLAYSPTINTVLEVPTDYTGILLLYIENEDWTATGEIEIRS